MEQFDYESKVWGANHVRVTPLYLGALRLRYCLADLKQVRGKVLDLGCGGGGMSRAIKHYRPDLDVYGADISTSAIHLSKKNPEGVHFVVGDIYHLSFPDKTFDAVVMFDLLEHLDKPKKALAEIARVLKPGGLFHSYTPCEGEISNYDFWLRKFGWHGKAVYAGHIQKFKASDLEAMLKSAGFVPYQKRWSNHFWNQLFDSAYFLLLSVRGRNAGYSLEGYVASGKKTATKGVMGMFVKLVAILTYLESRTLTKVPGHGVHLSVIKK